MLGGEGEGVAEVVGDELVSLLVREAGVVVGPGLGRVEERGEFGD